MPQKNCPSSGHFHRTFGNLHIQFRKVGTLGVFAHRMRDTAHLGRSNNRGPCHFPARFAAPTVASLLTWAWTWSTGKCVESGGRIPLKVDSARPRTLSPAAARLCTSGLPPEHMHTHAQSHDDRDDTRMKWNPSETVLPPQTGVPRSV